MSSAKQTQEPVLSDEDLIEAQEVIADQALKSDMGWDILQGLHRQCVEKALTTRGFTLPVMQELPTLDKKLSDPAGFRQSFQTLLGDLNQYHVDLKKLHAKHATRTGQPSEAEWPILFQVSNEYSQLIDRFDLIISPLIFSLVEIIKHEHGDMLNLVTTAESEA